MVKDSALSLLWEGLPPRQGNLHMPQAQQKKKKKKSSNVLMVLLVSSFLSFPPPFLPSPVFILKSISDTVIVVP